MYCLYCGTKIPDDAVFCLRCGKRQHQESLAKSMPEAQETAHMDREPTIERTPLAAGSVSSEQSIPDSEEKTRNTPPGISQPTSGLTRPVTAGQPKKGRMSP